MADDNTDGYSGVGIEFKKAEKIFEERLHVESCCKAFKEKGLTEKDALINAQLARILTTNDYDHEKKEPILWTPTSNYKIDDGARLEATTA